MHEFSNCPSVFLIVFKSGHNRFNSVLRMFQDSFISLRSYWCFLCDSQSFQNYVSVFIILVCIGSFFDFFFWVFKKIIFLFCSCVQQQLLGCLTIFLRFFQDSSRFCSFFFSKKLLLREWKWSENNFQKIFLSQSLHKFQFRSTCANKLSVQCEEIDRSRT